MPRLIAILLIVAAALPARADLVLEYIQVPAINAPASAAPALTSLTVPANGSVFIQIALRDTLGSGPEYGQPGTVPWFTNNNTGLDPIAVLGAFFVRFDSIPGVATNPAPTAPANARLVFGTVYASVAAGSSPPTFTRLGGLLNVGFEGSSTAVPDPVTHRLALFNLRIHDSSGGAGGSGVFRLRDPNPTNSSVDNAILEGTGGPGTLTTIDDVLFGPAFTGTYDLPVVVVPEPSALTLAGLAAFSAAYFKRRRDYSGGVHPRRSNPGGSRRLP